MIWEENYPEELLEMGYKLYKAGNVGMPKKGRNGLIYKVRGDYFSSDEVVIDVSRKNEKVHSCTCSYASYYEECEHIVAALYAFEDKGKAIVGKMDNNPKIDPFKKEKDSEYHYYDIEDGE